MSFAIVDIAGFQEKVTPGMRLRVPLLKAKDGENVTFKRVLLLSDSKGKLNVGKPFIEGAAVEAKVVQSGRGEKIRVFKMKHRKRYRRTRGHRQDFTDIEVTKISE